MKSEALLIKNARIVDPSQRMNQEGDIWIEDGRVRAIEKPGQIPARPGMRVIDAKGKIAMPGLIDLHVHLREPGLEYKESIETGTRAAAAGGFSSVACMANTSPVNDTPYVTAYIREKAKAVAACRVHIVGAVTKGLKGEELAEIGGMIQEGALALSDDGMPVMNSYLMRKAMDYAKAFGVPIISHAEDANLVGKGVMNESALSNELGLRGIPAAAEEIMIAREVALARLTRCPVHIQHISTAIGLEHVRRAKDDGLPVTAEASPHHLTLTEECVRTYDTSYKMSPPLRTEKDVEALRDGVKTGLIDAIATDHAPHGVIDKAVEFGEASNGIIGLQTAVPVTFALVHDGIISLDRWVESLTLAPAKLLKLSLGTLKAGAAADLTLLDPIREWTFTQDENHSKSQNSPYLGHKLRGKVLLTLVDGIAKYSEEGL
ncbi:MAG: dihydroorotase [Bdellovibrionales bacterium]|nr:dihydroorotase [Bdellovibrionales bacterium]